VKLLRFQGLLMRERLAGEDSSQVNQPAVPIHYLHLEVRQTPSRLCLVNWKKHLVADSAKFVLRTAPAGPH